MPEYDSAVALALRLIDKKGRDVTVRGFTDNAPADPDQPWNPSAPTPVNASARGVYLESQRSYATGELFEAVTALFLVAASGLAVEPTPKGRVVDGAVEWHISSVAQLRPGDQVVMYELRVSR